MGEGDPFPHGTVHPPPLLPGADYILDKFWKLNTNRQLGPGIFGPIHSDALDNFMDRAGFTGTPIEATFEKGIRVLDEMWIEHIFEQIHANNPGNSTTKTALTVSSTPLSPELFDTLF